jgi:hypothetical protein
MGMTGAVVIMSVRQKTTAGRMCQDTFSSFAVIAVGMQQGAFCATNNSISGIKHHQHLQPNVDPESTYSYSDSTAKHTTPPRKKAPINKRNPSKGSD